MPERFEARNELEQKLMAAQEGNLPENGFMHYLLEAQVFMPVRDSINIAGFSGSDVGVSLNPTWAVGMDLEAGLVRQLRSN